jgi:hypothetical protein
MSGDSTPAERPATAAVRRLLATTVTTQSREPLTGIIELRIEGGYLELKIDEETALALRTDIERFLTQ